jgi:cystathionine beta-lyase/cystathionine gamma-synthase
MSHASVPEAVRGQRKLPEDLVRISAGIEDPEDLIADLTQAFALAETPAAPNSIAAAASAPE